MTGRSARLGNLPPGFFQTPPAQLFVEKGSIEWEIGGQHRAYMAQGELLNRARGRAR